MVDSVDATSEMQTCAHNETAYCGTVYFVFSIAIAVSIVFAIAFTVAIILGAFI